MRTATIKRKTKETDIEVAVNLDGTGVSRVATGIGFFDHMLDLLARHSRIDITVKADGDLHVDHHHTTEDVGIALGQAVKQALGTMAGITRYASIHMPMDETLSRVVIDISGRPVLVFKVDFPRDKVGDFDTELVREWFNAFAMNAGVTLHVETLYGENSHHIAESCFKGLAQGAAGSGRDRSTRRRRSAIHQGSARRLIAVRVPVRGGELRCRSTQCMPPSPAASISRRPTSSSSCATASISGPWSRRDLAGLASAVAGADRLDRPDGRGPVGLAALGVSRGTILVVNLLLALLMGLEAASLQRWTLSRRKWRQLDVVVADDEEDRRARASSIAGPPGSAVSSTTNGRSIAAVRRRPATFRVSRSPNRRRMPQGGIIGLFPEPGGSR